MKEIEGQFAQGLVTQGEKYNKVIDIWSRANDKVAKAMMDNLGKEDVVDKDGNTVRRAVEITVPFQKSFLAIANEQERSLDQVIVNK